MPKLPKKTKWAPKLLAALLIAMAVVVVVLLANHKTPMAELNGTTVQLEVVSDPAARAKGLSGRSGLLPNHGMLFVFDSSAQQGIWMKDMRFNIDALWLDEGGQVVAAVEDMTPASYPRVYTSQLPCLYALELPAGFIKEHSVQVGSRVRLPKL